MPLHNAKLVKLDSLILHRKTILAVLPKATSITLHAILTQNWFLQTNGVATNITNYMYDRKHYDYAMTAIRKHGQYPFNTL